jgi:hypothetical protein
MSEPSKVELRAMFACWAPQEIPHWFQPGVGTRPDPIWKSLDDAFVFTSRYQAEKKCGEEGYRCANQEELDSWERGAMMKRYFAWRWFYADQMLHWRDECSI